MSTSPKRPRDTNQLAKLLVDVSVGEAKEPKLTTLTKKRAASGKQGGIKGGKSRMSALTDDQRRELAKKAASKRWGKAAMGDKLLSGQSVTLNSSRGYVTLVVVTDLGEILLVCGKEEFEKAATEYREPMAVGFKRSALVGIE